MVSFAKNLPAQDMLATLERADSIGFIADPTRYRDALFSGSLDFQRMLISAVLAFQKATSRLPDIANAVAKRQATSTEALEVLLRERQ